MCIISKTLEAKDEVRLGKDNIVCFAQGQTGHSEFSEDNLSIQSIC